MGAGTKGIRVLCLGAVATAAACSQDQGTPTVGAGSGDGSALATAAPTELGVYTLFKETNLNGIRVGLMAPEAVLELRPDLYDLEVASLAQAFVPGVESVRTFELTGDASIDGALRVRVAWSSELPWQASRLAVVSWDAGAERWTAAPTVERDDNAFVVEIGHLSKLALVEMGVETRLDTALPAEAWSLVDLTAAPAAEAAAGEKAIVFPAFYVRTPLDAPPTGGEAVCVEVRIDGVSTTYHLPLQSGGNYRRQDIPVDVVETVMTRYFIASSSACADEQRTIFPDDGASWYLPTYVADVPAPNSACATDSGDPCGRYYSSFSVTARRAATPNGTLACPGSPAFLAGDLNTNGVLDSCEIVDNCPEDPEKLEPGVCGCGTPETDSDTDGTPDCNDACPAWPGGTVPGPCGCNIDVPEVCGNCGPTPDADNDGTPDCYDDCPYDFGSRNVCGGCGSAPDGDNDGTPDCFDDCALDPAKTEPGQCGCGEPETDDDTDGVADCVDVCLDDSGNDTELSEPVAVFDCMVSGAFGGEPVWMPLAAICNGVPDCPPLEAAGGLALDEVLCTSTISCEGVPVTAAQVCDGVNQWADSGCPTSDETLLCATGFYEGDGVCSLDDNCPDDLNPGQEDADSDGVGDACDACFGNNASGDTDSDGTCDDVDACDDDASKTEPGVCGCGVADTDNDNDLAADCNETCDEDPDKTEPGVCGCGVADTDTDNDGEADCIDGCPNDPNKTATGLCGCGVVDDQAPTCAELRCGNGECLARSAICDGNVDCTDGSDEVGCAPTCDAVVESFQVEDPWFENVWAMFGIPAAQSFTLGADTDVTAVVLPLYSNHFNGLGEFVVTLRTVSGGLPTATVLGTSAVVHSSTLPHSDQGGVDAHADITFAFDPSVSLAPGEYTIVLEATSGNPNAQWRSAAGNMVGGSYASGLQAEWDEFESLWVDSQRDGGFAVLGCEVPGGG